MRNQSICLLFILTNIMRSVANTDLSVASHTKNCLMRRNVDANTRTKLPWRLSDRQRMLRHWHYGRRRRQRLF